MNTRPLWLAVTAAAGLLALPLGYALSLSLNPAEPTNVLSSNPPASGELTDDSIEPEVIVAPPDSEGDMRSPGVWNWWDLRGGECLAAVPTTLIDPVTVAPCDTPHRARYLRPVVVPGAVSAPFPEVLELEAVARDHCGTLRLEDLGGLQGHDDLVVRPLAPLDSALWERGPRVMGCVISRESGETVRSDLMDREGSDEDETPSP